MNSSKTMPEPYNKDGYPVEHGTECFCSRCKAMRQGKPWPAQHTPGPWIWEREDDSTWVVKSEDYGTIVYVNQYPDANVMPDEECEATAALIAAAPDLLEAVKRAVSELGIRHDHCRHGSGILLGNILVDAIAKAQGGAA